MYRAHNLLKGITETTEYYILQPSTIQTKHRVYYLEMAHRVFPSIAKARLTFPHYTQQNRNAIPTDLIINLLKLIRS